MLQYMNEREIKDQCTEKFLHNFKSCDFLMSKTSHYLIHFMCIQITMHHTYYVFWAVDLW